jgi:hypothetical protein
VDASSKVHFIPVQIGRDQGENVEIVQGLTGKERVISAPVGSLVEGTLVAEGSAPLGPPH